MKKHYTYFRCFLNWTAHFVPVFSFLSASLTVIVFLFVSLTLSAHESILPVMDFNTSESWTIENTYIVPVKNDTGCAPNVMSGLGRLTIPFEVTIQDIRHVSCHGGSDGEATAEVSGGRPPYIYFWNNGDQTATATGLSAAIWWVEVTDADGKTEKAIVTIDQPSEIKATSVIKDAGCDESTGKITVNAWGGTGSFEYMLAEHTGWQISNTFENLAPEIYDAIVREAAAPDCEFTLPGLEVKNIPAPTISTCNSHHSTYGLPNGSVKIIAEGLALPLKYSITGDGSDWQESSEFFGLLPGIYTAWIMDANGCKDSMEFTILKEAEGDAVISAETNDYCVNNPVELSVEASNFTRISSFYFELEFNPDILSFSSFTSTLLPEKDLDISLSPAGNILLIEFSIAPLSVTIEDNQILLQINFVALGSGESKLVWTQPNCKIFESAGNRVPDFYRDGKATINPAPVISATGGGEYSEGTGLILFANSPDESDFTWTSPTGNIYYGAELHLNSLSMMDNGLFRVTAVNKYLCRDEKTVNVIVISGPKLLFPNAFSPDEDGINDKFKPLVAPGWELDRYLMQVFNRWGEKVFETNDHKEGWDGTYKEVPVPPGLYRYIIIFDVSSYERSLISNLIQGNVTVVR